VNLRLGIRPALAAHLVIACRMAAMNESEPPVRGQEGEVLLPDGRYPANT
jgi:hypothetical protein